MRDWKSRHFVNTIWPGMKIYESAAGTGLNELMTMEIIAEASNDSVNLLDGVTLYGNEYIPESAHVANMLLSYPNLLPGKARLVSSRKQRKGLYA